MVASVPLKKVAPEPAVGDEGADLACTGTSSSSDRSAGGNSSETLRFWWRENLGIGRELGGGELQNPGPAQSSGREGGDVEGLTEIARLRFFPMVKLLVFRCLGLGGGAGPCNPLRGWGWQDADGDAGVEGPAVAGMVAACGLRRREMGRR